MNDLRRIIWLASFPKSGNTWVRSFLANYFQPPGKALDIKSVFRGQCPHQVAQTRLRRRQDRRRGEGKRHDQPRRPAGALRSRASALELVRREVAHMQRDLAGGDRLET